MTSFDFQTTTHGKWILAGEHAVLRGSPALVFPLNEKSLTLTYQANNDKTLAEFTGECGDDAHLLFWSVVEQAAEKTNHSINDIKGHFQIHNTIPIGAGLGASGALCAAVAKWFVWRGWVKAEDLFSFARNLENLFHRNSSGIDIVGALATSGTLFWRDKPWQPFQPQWQPNWYLSFSNEMGITSHCVKKVESRLQTSPDEAQQIDQQMQESVAIAQTALSQDAEHGFDLLTKAIHLANDCFVKWDLTGGELGRHIDALLDAGAVAAKPTGSGAGGYILSLWDQPPEAPPFELIALR
jgi:mevalonate kinase